MLLGEIEEQLNWRAEDVDLGTSKAVPVSSTVYRLESAHTATVIKT